MHDAGNGTARCGRKYLRNMPHPLNAFVSAKALLCVLPGNEPEPNTLRPGAKNRAKNSVRNKTAPEILHIFTALPASRKMIFKKTDAIRLRMSGQYNIMNALWR